MALLLGSLLPLHARAQQETSVPRDSNGSYTLHVRTDLVQIPTLVLNPNRESYAGLAASSFRIELDRGPAFQPRHIRVEGEDALTLAVLLDVNRKGNDSLPNDLEGALGTLGPELLAARDRISVYAFDCNLVRGAEAVPASNEAFRAGVAEALRSPALHRDRATGRGCRNPLHLWDAIGLVGGQLQQAPTRRVLVVLSDGDDRGSLNTWVAARTVLTARSVAAFGIRPSSLRDDAPREALQRLRLPVMRAEVPFALLCAGSGGVVFDSTAQTLPSVLQKAVELVRSRYILDFPRPHNGTPGQHSLDVTVKDDNATVLPSGVSFPPLDGAWENEPGAVPSDPQRTPVEGSRRILAPKR